MCETLRLAKSNWTEIGQCPACSNIFIWHKNVIVTFSECDFLNFYDKFKELGIAKELKDSIDNWSYDKLDEVNRIAPLIKEKMKKNGII